MQRNIEPINIEENGWEIKDKIYPVWFTGPQLPPSCLHKKKIPKIVTNYEGDNDSDTSLKKPPKKRLKKSAKVAISNQTRTERKKILTKSRDNLDSDYDADINASSDELESNDNISSSDGWDWEHYSEFDEYSNDDSSGSDWIM